MCYFFKVVELEKGMIAELIKLSKELYEMEMIEESLGIDSMIHKLYGIASVAKNDIDVNEDESLHSFGDYSDLRSEIMANASNDMFKGELANIIYESFEANDIEEIRDLLTDYIE